MLEEEQEQEQEQEDNDNSRSSSHMSCSNHVEELVAGSSARVVVGGVNEMKGDTESSSNSSACSRNGSPRNKGLEVGTGSTSGSTISNHNSSDEHAQDTPNMGHPRQQQQQDEEDAAGSTTTTATTTRTTTTTSHFLNSKYHPMYIRYGIPLYFAAALGLLLRSDIGSGVSAITVLKNEDYDYYEESTLLTESIFSAVDKLWGTKSYALAILIAVTSVSWPYVKILLSLLVWFLPFTITTTTTTTTTTTRNPSDNNYIISRTETITTPEYDTHKGKFRIETLVQYLDILGKWSFVDIVVFVEIAVAFRAYIWLGAGVSTDIYVIPQWGFYGFVGATILSIIGTQLILYYHRKIVYPNNVPKQLYIRNTNKKQTEMEQQMNAIDDFSMSYNAGDARYTNNLFTNMTASANNSHHNNTNNSQRSNNNTSTNQSTLQRRPWLIKNSKNTKDNIIVLILILFFGLIMHIISCVLKIFTVKRTRGTVEENIIHFSLLDIGSLIPNSSIDPNSPGIKWLQFMWYYLFIIMPIITNILFIITLLTIFYKNKITKQNNRKRRKLMKMRNQNNENSNNNNTAVMNNQIQQTFTRQETNLQTLLFWLYTMVEISFAWSCSEVAVVSTISAVLQIPTFGSGMIEAGCTTCFVVDSYLISTGITIVIFATIINLSIFIYLHKHIHSILLIKPAATPMLEENEEINKKEIRKEEEKAIMEQPNGSGIEEQEEMTEKI